MTGEYERAMRHAIDQFVAEITRVAETAAIEAIQTAFVHEAVRRPRRVSAVARVPELASMAAVTSKTRGSEPSTSATASAASAASDDSARESTPAESDGNPIWHRIIAYLRENPGSHVGLLNRALGVPPARLRRLLHQLAQRGAVRVEVHYEPRLGRELRRFTAVESPPAETSQSHECQATEELSGESSELADRRTVSLPPATGFS